MALAEFFHQGSLVAGHELWLDEDTARHVVQVLRMNAGAKLQLTDGKGHVAVAAIQTAEKKKCKVLLNSVVFHEPSLVVFHLGLAFTKNTSRNEWLLEKATELGVKSIIPLVATRSEREKIRYDRWHNILVSAMLQSQQYYLPVLHEAMDMTTVIEKFREVPQRLVGHCIEGLERRPLQEMLKPGRETLILIGPEGDFTAEEVNLCTQAQYTSVSLGRKRLRTETAAMAVCAYFNLVNHA